MNSSISTCKPDCCPICGSAKLHKTESRTQLYKDIMNGKDINVIVKRQRYRCPSCFNKIWDTVVGACPYRRKSEKLLQALQIRPGTMSVEPLQTRNIGGMRG